MKFTNDVFISYRHIDNRPISGSVGWIDDFERKLKAQLAFKLGYDPIIWRDAELRGNEFFDEVLVNQLAQSKILISILSPGYIDPSSDWCLRELAEFCRLAQTNIGLRIGEKTRCLKVVKTVLARDKHPSALKGPLGYEFFDEDPQLRRLRDFSYLPDGYQHNRYLDKIDQISFDIAELLTEINNSKPSAVTGPTVYLAESTSDRAEYRDSIQNELRSRGYRVLPDEELPQTATEYREAVKKNLEQAVLAVHLIGNRYGRILEGEEEKSIVDIQNELAAQRSVELPTFLRVIWIAPDVIPTGKYHPAFVSSLKTDSQAQKGAEVIERSFEELKNRIIERLTTPKPTKPPQPRTFEDLVRIYVMCDKSDFTTVKELRDYLFEKKYEVILSAREGDDRQAIQFHKDNLLDCDAALIYYGAGNEFWQHSKLSDLRKAAGWGREKPMLCKAIYKASPETDHKREYRTWEAVILNPPGYTGFAADALEEFISCIQAARAEQVRTGGGAR